MGDGDSMDAGNKKETTGNGKLNRNAKSFPVWRGQEKYIAGDAISGSRLVSTREQSKPTTGLASVPKWIAPGLVVVSARVELSRVRTVAATRRVCAGVLGWPLELRCRAVKMSSLRVSSRRERVFSGDVEERSQEGRGNAVHKPVLFAQRWRLFCP